MEYVLLTLGFVIFYVLPGISVWKLTRRVYREVWTELEPDLADVMLVFFPLGNIVTCIELSKRLSQKKKGKTVYERFFRL